MLLTNDNNDEFLKACAHFAPKTMNVSTILLSELQITNAPRILLLFGYPIAENDDCLEDSAHFLLDPVADNFECLIMSFP